MKSGGIMFVSHHTRTGVPEGGTLIGMSVNVEHAGPDGELPDQLVGRKFLVDTMELPQPKEGGLCRIQVRGHQEPLELRIKIDRRAYAAGSSLNVARVLRDMGTRRPISILAPFGDDEDGAFLKSRIGKLGFGSIPLEAPATAVTLTLRDPSCQKGCTLFCKKHPCAPPDRDELEEIFEGKWPREVLLTSTRQDDLGTAEILAAEATFLALMPHKELLASMSLSKEGAEARESRTRLKALAQKATYLQVNEYEAAVFLGVDVFEPRQISVLHEHLPSSSIAVTLAHRGAVYQDEFRTISTSPEKIERIIDSSGAGDTHFAAFLYYRHMCAFRPRQALEAANWIAARTVAHEGPCRGLPPLEERNARFTTEWREEWP